MTRVVVLRPEPGASRTASRIGRAGGTAICRPLFAVRALDWQPSDPGGFDVLLLTSANAPRLAGPGLAMLSALPVVAVGRTTAQAARARGLRIVLTGSGDAAAVLSQAQGMGFTRPLHLAGRDRRMLPGVVAVPVYASDPILPPPDLGIAEGARVMLHSPRAARVFALAAEAQRLNRDRITLVAISTAAAEAAGPGWQEVRVAAEPRDAAMCACAIDPSGGDGDKAA